MPRLTCSASSRKCMLHGVSSDQLFAMPMTGRPSKLSSGSPSERSHERCMMPVLPSAREPAALQRLGGVNGAPPSLMRNFGRWCSWAAISASVSASGGVRVGYRAVRDHRLDDEVTVAGHGRLDREVHRRQPPGEDRRQRRGQVRHGDRTDAPRRGDPGDLERRVVRQSWHGAAVEHVAREHLARVGQHRADDRDQLLLLAADCGRRSTRPAARCRRPAATIDW